MISGAPLPDEVPAGTVVTLHAERGVVFEGDIVRQESIR
jgi:pyruvate kinase